MAQSEINRATVIKKPSFTLGFFIRTISFLGFI